MKLVIVLLALFGAFVLVPAMLILWVVIALCREGLGKALDDGLKFLDEDFK